MQSFEAASRSEYLPSQSDAYSQNGNGNGHSNGNGHAKIFSLKPATDPDTLAILDARRNALAEPPDRLSRSMKVCFCEILDRALNPAFFDSKGVVTISDSVLAQIFSVSNRTIYTWKKQLEECGYVWLSQKWKSNMWPITTYHLACLHRQRREGKTDSDGTYGTGRLRSAPVNAGEGARKPGQRFLPLPGTRQPAPDPTLPGSESTPDDPKNAVLQGISGLSREKDPVSPEEKIGSEPKKRSGESRSKDRARAEEKIGSEPIKRSGESRSLVPPTADPRFRHIETQIEKKSLQEGGEGAKPPQEGDWDREFKSWQAALGKKFDRELRATLDDLKEDRKKHREFPTAESPEKLRRLKLKIEAVQILLTGPK